MKDVRLSRLPQDIQDKINSRLIELREHGYLTDNARVKYQFDMDPIIYITDPQLCDNGSYRYLDTAYQVRHQVSYMGKRWSPWKSAYTAVYSKIERL